MAHHQRHKTEIGYQAMADLRHSVDLGSKKKIGNINSIATHQGGGPLNSQGSSQNA